VHSGLARFTLITLITLIRPRHSALSALRFVTTAPQTFVTTAPLTSRGCGLFLMLQRFNGKEL
jgi:hypothetical protein